MARSTIALASKLDPEVATESVDVCDIGQGQADSRPFPADTDLA